MEHHLIFVCSGMRMVSVITETDGFLFLKFISYAHYRVNKFVSLSLLPFFHCKLYLTYPSTITLCMCVCGVGGGGGAGQKFTSVLEVTHPRQFLDGRREHKCIYFYRMYIVGEISVYQIYHLRQTKPMLTYSLFTCANLPTEL